MSRSDLVGACTLRKPSVSLSRLCLARMTAGKKEIVKAEDAYFLSALYAGFTVTKTAIIVYQYQSKLSSGSQSFAIIKKKATTLSCASFKSSQLICFTFESA